MGVGVIIQEIQEYFKNHNFGLNYPDKTLTAQLALRGKCVKYHHMEADIIPGASLNVSEHLITHSL